MFCDSGITACTLRSLFLVGIDFNSTRKNKIFNAKNSHIWRGKIKISWNQGHRHNLHSEGAGLMIIAHKARENILV